MTREEASYELERLLRHWDDLENDKRRFWGYDQEAVEIALSALRPITREQAKETKAVFFQPGVEDVAQDSYRCSHCYVQEFGDTRGINFCPHCGAPMTDEAVEILVKRMEEMRND